MFEPEEPKFTELRTQKRHGEEPLYWFSYKLSAMYPHAKHLPAYKRGEWDGISSRKLIASIERKVISWMIETYETTELFGIITDEYNIAVIAKGKNAATAFKLRFT